ncbi:zinc finger (ccch type) domain-containing protein [Cyclospora cayetanensis]|uniref:Zinc finger (Ccch type) domain-containing protein n=1 Tax=Cyclospora cayetanensis TaxID=88456 RepID=A0A1D3CUZ8_9EIME|nr:zinc finger (ccch type) domain-containing protein [Cyclospora cayetanensis]
MQAKAAGAAAPPEREPCNVAAPPGLEALGTAPGFGGCTTAISATSSSPSAAREGSEGPRRLPLSGCTSYRSVAARALTDGAGGRRDAGAAAEVQAPATPPYKGRGVTVSRSADKLAREEKGQGSRLGVGGGGYMETGAPPFANSTSSAASYSSSSLSAATPPSSASTFLPASTPSSSSPTISLVSSVSSSSGGQSGQEKTRRTQEARLQAEIQLLCPLPVLDESLEHPQELHKLKTLFVDEMVKGLPRRRSPIDPSTGRLLYWDRPCYAFDSRGASCASGLSCAFCHTIEELLLHPARFRSELITCSKENNAWHAASSIAELRLRAPEAYGLEAHLRQLHDGSVHPLERVDETTAPQEPKDRYKDDKNHGKVSQKAKQTAPIEEARAYSSSSTEANSVEESCGGSSSGCCSGVADCRVPRFEYSIVGSPLPSSSSVSGEGNLLGSGSGCVKCKAPYAEEDASAVSQKVQLLAQEAAARNATQPAETSLAVSVNPSPCNGQSGSFAAEAAVLALGSTARSRLTFGWEDQDGALNLSSFKVFPCRHKHSLSHDKKYCPFYHNFRDKRRFPVTYRAEQCEEHFDLDSSTLQCSKGDACEKSHNRHELLYHPTIFKQRFCSSYATRNGTERCGRGQFCAFAHSREEVRAPLFTIQEETCPSSDFFMQHFKTVWCPYGVQHDWYTCVYAHTYQDCRRSPQVGAFSDEVYQERGLARGTRGEARGMGGERSTLCPYSHGSKEQLYHPSYYKTMPCMDFRSKGRGGGGNSCPRGVLCAFYHETSERRWPLRISTDYSTPLPSQRNSLLQPQFLRPPLFNLDDFEAFGHTSRKTSSKKDPQQQQDRQDTLKSLSTSASVVTALPFKQQQQQMADGASISLGGSLWSLEQQQELAASDIKGMKRQSLLEDLSLDTNTALSSWVLQQLAADDDVAAAAASSFDLRSKQRLMVSQTHIKLGDACVFPQLQIDGSLIGTDLHSDASASPWGPQQEPPLSTPRAVGGEEVSSRELPATHRPLELLSPVEQPLGGCTAGGPSVGATRSASLFDSSGVWGVAHQGGPSPGERSPFEHCTLSQETEKRTCNDAADVLLQMLGRAAQAPKCGAEAAPQRGGGPPELCYGADEFSDAAARLPPIPPPTLHCLADDGFPVNADAGSIFENSASSLPLSGARLASVYLIASNEEAQQKALCRLVAARACPKLLLLHKRRMESQSEAELRISAARAGYALTTSRSSTGDMAAVASVPDRCCGGDSEFSFWNTSGASLSLDYPPCGVHEVAELLERAATCGTHVCVLYLHSSQEDLLSACKSLAAYCATQEVAAAQERIFLLHLCPSVPPQQLQKHLLPHATALPLSRLRRWAALLKGPSVGHLKGGLREPKYDTEDRLLQAHSQHSAAMTPTTAPPAGGSNSDHSADGAEAGSSERWLQKTEDAWAAGSPTCSVYSLPYMHEDLQWTPWWGFGSPEEDGRVGIEGKREEFAITPLKRELEFALAEARPSIHTSGLPCVLVELDDDVGDWWLSSRAASQTTKAATADAAAAEQRTSPPGLPATPVSRMQGHAAAIAGGGGTLHREAPRCLLPHAEELEALGFSVLTSEDRGIKVWKQQLGASCAVHYASGAPLEGSCKGILAKGPRLDPRRPHAAAHRWASWGTQRLGSSHGQMVLFRRTLPPTASASLVEALRLLASAHTPAGASWGLLSCVNVVHCKEAENSAVYIQLPDAFSTADTLWVCSLQQLLTGCGAHGNLNEENAGTASLRKEAAWDSQPAATSCCVRLLHDICASVIEAYGLLQQVVIATHPSKKAKEEAEGAFEFAVGLKDILVAGHKDGRLFACVDLVAPHVLLAALKTTRAAGSIQKGSASQLRDVLRDIISSVLTRGSSAPPQLRGAPLAANLLGSLWRCGQREAVSCCSHPFFWSCSERLSFLQVALALAHMPQQLQQRQLEDTAKGVDGAWGAKLAVHIRGVTCTGQSWLLAKARKEFYEAEEPLAGPPALDVLVLADRLRQRWLYFSSQLAPECVAHLLQEIGHGSALQQQRQHQLLLLVQHADEVLSTHVETEAPGLLLSVFLLARENPDVLQMMHASPSLAAVRHALQTTEDMN